MNAGAFDDEDDEDDGQHQQSLSPPTALGRTTSPFDIPDRFPPPTTVLRWINRDTPGFGTYSTAPNTTTSTNSVILPPLWRPDDHRGRQSGPLPGPSTFAPSLSTSSSSSSSSRPVSSAGGARKRKRSVEAPSPTRPGGSTTRTRSVVGDNVSRVATGSTSASASAARRRLEEEEEEEERFVEDRNEYRNAPEDQYVDAESSDTEPETDDELVQVVVHPPLNNNQNRPLRRPLASNTTMTSSTSTISGPASALTITDIETRPTSTVTPASTSDSLSSSSKPQQHRASPTPTPTPIRAPHTPDGLSEYTCPICFCPPTNATITPCGHICCGACLFTAVKTTLHRGAMSFTREPNVAR
ncbi:hypothetical protein AX15_002272 [Amanita polypyramis BW_CC]|nr:hypothetical protein AX15_002272 [Amanita polypyramis BW_CC]